jgi:hypothetical protein
MDLCGTEFLKIGCTVLQLGSPDNTVIKENHPFIFDDSLVGISFILATRSLWL